MQIPFVDLKSQYLSIKNEIDEAIQKVLLESAFIKGEFLKSFETNFKSYIGAKHCIGTGNGTDALFISLKILGVGPGDEVITAANSFIASSEAITLTGARVVFVDCDEQTFNIDVKKTESAVTNKTKAIISVHLYGQSANMDELIGLAKKNNLFLIEDAAQAHGAKYKGKNIGTLGDCACFSFFPGKNLGAYGDAGAIVTNNDEFAQKARMYANHGRMEKYDHEFEGMNSRLDGLQAAVLDVKLKHLKKWTQRRRAIAKIYDEELGKVVIVPFEMPNLEHVYHLYVVRLKNREKIIRYLNEKGISTGVHYPIPLPFLKAYSYLSHNAEDFPVACRIKDEILSLPLYDAMTDNQMLYVIEQLKKAVNVC